MADYKTDEEKVEELKVWWSKNGSSVIAGVLIAIAGLFGWQYWLSYAQSQTEEASLLFSQLDTKSTDQSVKKLQSSYDSTPYATLASLSFAKTQIEKGKNELAVVNLQWVVKNSKDTHFQNIARLRLVRVYLATQKIINAEKLLQYKYPVAYLSLVDELKGDLYVAQNKLTKARESYGRAILSANANNNASVNYLKMKRDDLGE